MKQGVLPHVPVLRERVQQVLQPRSRRVRTLLDATVGAGAHAASLLQANAASLDLLVGLDRDASALEHARSALAQACANVAPHTPSVELVQCNFQYDYLSALLRGTCNGRCSPLLLLHAVS